MKKARWSDGEIEFLRSRWAYLPIPEIQKTINRSWLAINIQAGKLGIKKDREAAWADNWKFIDSNPYDCLTATELSYIAGIIDGEGTIDRQIGNRPEAWRISVGNTDKNLIDWLHAKVPYSRVTVNKRRFHWKQSWRWALLSNIKVYRLLQLASPYMIVKKDKADEAIRDLHVKWLRLARLQGAAEAGNVGSCGAA